ncbi:MAG: hypothetical protein HY906_14045 [Deltaproteobacteria bacterium]|nr:hypothetical protein [Deltaproteobacteria bacterium]
MRWLTLALAALALGCGDNTGGDPDAGWAPLVVHWDKPYVQEVSVRLGTTAEARSLALAPDGTCHVATANGVSRWDGESWQPVDTGLAGEAVDLAFSPSGDLAVVGPAGATVAGAAVDLPPGAAPTFVMPRAAGGWWIGGDTFAGAWDGSFASIFDSIQQPVRAVVDLPDGTWLAATPAGIATPSGFVTTADGLPSDDVRSLAVDADGVVWAGTGAGLARRDPTSGAWRAFLGADGLHHGDVLRLGFDAGGTLLVATRMGASAFHPDGRRRYYFGRIWLPEDEVRGAARAADGTLFFATAGGVARVEQRRKTLAERAAIHDRGARERHVRLGYTATQCHLATAGDLATVQCHDDDNDGQWTAMYLASQCFRYAVTGEPEARESARVAAYALLKLEEVTGVPGFFARSIVAGAECAAKQGGAGEWHLSADGAWCWKGNTSSDEFVGHVLGLSLFYDLVATTEERADVAATFGRILDHIIECGYLICDVDGLPTEDGHFDPDFMENDFRALLGDAGLNSAMILGGLRAAHHMTGAQRFLDAFDYLARERDYQANVRRIEEINTTYHVNHDSEEMSFLALYTLMRLETDPALWAVWREGLEGLWQARRPERDPELNMIYAALARADAYDLDQSVETLQKLPLDMVQWGLDLSHRWDRDEDPELDRFDQKQNRFVFPYAERMPERWSENPFAYRQGGDGHAESSGTFWLLPYWMGRYVGVIR